MFGHTVRGPLRLLREKFLSNKTGLIENMLDYVSSFRERLHHTCDLARDSLSTAQSKMKTHFDKKSVVRTFTPGDRVLVLLPLVGPSLQAKFCGPYEVDRKLSETDYVIHTPDRRKKTCVCHINMLKTYVGREKSASPPIVAPIATVSVAQPAYDPSDDGLNDRRSSSSCVCLKNAEILSNLVVHLVHLSDSARTDIDRLVQNHPTLFGDIPTQTNVMSRY